MAMRDLKLDLLTKDLIVNGSVSNKDLSITNLDEGEALSQRLLIKLRYFKGEWHLNTDFGIPYIQTIFTKSATKSVVDSIFRKAVLDTEDVSEILEFTSTLDAFSRTYSLTLKVRSEDGDTVTISL